METLAEKILGEICREVDTEAMDARPQEVLVIKVPPGLEAHRWGVAHEGEDLPVEASVDRHEVILAAKDLVGFMEKAIDIIVNDKNKLTLTMCHCERLPAGRQALAMTPSQGRLL